MRIRSIKPEFWRSDDIARLKIEDRLLFIGLWSYVDDSGVGPDKLSHICADLFAPDLERDPTEVFGRVTRGLLELSARGLIVRYKAEGKSLLYIRQWKAHQRIDKPSLARFPLPDMDSLSDPEIVEEGSGSVPEKGALGAGEQGNRGAGEQGAEEQGARSRLLPKAAEAAPGHPLIPRETVFTLPLVGGGTFDITDQDVSILTPAYPALNILHELAKARAWLLSNPKNGKTKAGMMRFVNNWMSQSQNKARPVSTGVNRQAALEMRNREVAENWRPSESGGSQ